MLPGPSLQDLTPQARSGPKRQGKAQDDAEETSLDHQQEGDDQNDDIPYKIHIMQR